MQVLVTIVKYVIIAFVCYSAYSLVSIAFSSKDKAVVMAKSVVDNALGKSKSSIFNEDKILADLSKYGVMYMTKDYNLEASTWILIKIMCSCLCGIVGFSFSVTILEKLLCVAALLAAGFFLPDGLIRLSNYEDNNAMTNDILSIYTILKIHARAGVYVTDSLIEAQRTITNGRLKQALNEMNNNILSSRVSMDEAIQQFNARFRNDTIDNLAIILLQATKSGQSISLLDDLSAQIANSNKIRLDMKKASLKRKLAIQQVMFFSTIVGMVIYLIIIEMTSSVSAI